MKRFSAIFLILFIAGLLLAVSGCDGGVKPAKYPGQEGPIGEPVEDPPAEAEIPDPPAGGQGGMDTLGGGSSGGNDTTQSIKSPVAPNGAAGVARPLQAEQEEPGTEDEGENGEDAAEEESVDEEEPVAEEEEKFDKDTPHKDRTPQEFRELGSFGFDFNNADEGKVAELNAMLTALDILTVNEQKYEYAGVYLTEDEEGVSRVDPLFIPDRIPDELRPMIPGEGLRGSLDDELRKLFGAQANASLRNVPIHITGVMEMSYSRMAQGLFNWRPFRIGQGQTMSMSYWGFSLNVTATHISDDIVILHLSTYDRWTGDKVGVTVPRSFHLGVT